MSWCCFERECCNAAIFGFKKSKAKQSRAEQEAEQEAEQREESRKERAEQSVCVITVASFWCV
jgi:hypothetical protein